MRKMGYTCAITEHWNPFARIRQDMFGFCDLVCLKPGQTVCVQTTSGAHTAERIEKIKAHDNYPILKAAGWKIMVLGWRKVKMVRGKKATKWQEKIIQL